MTTNQTGFIRLYIGPMFSGKTTSLLEDYTRYKIAGKKCLLVKYLLDTRYDKNNLVTHSYIINKENISCSELKEIDNIVYNYNVICIDEIQFYNDCHIYCDKWASKGLIVICSGLNGDYKREPFNNISKLIPISEEIYKKNAVCIETGRDASFTYKYTNINEKIIDIGGNDKYKAVDRETYNKYNKNNKNDK